MTRLHLVIWLLYFFFKLWIVTPSPCPVEAAHDFWGLLYGSHNVSVIKCFCVIFQTCSMSSCWYTRGFFLFQDIVLLAMSMSNSCVMALIDFFFYFPLFSASKWFVFSEQIEFSQAKPRVQTKRLHSELLNA